MNSNLEQYIQMSDNNEVGGSGIDLRAGQSTVPVDLMCSFGVADFQYFPTQRYNELIKLYFSSIRNLSELNYSATITNGAKEAIYFAVKNLKHKGRKKLWIPDVAWIAYSIIAAELNIEVALYGAVDEELFSKIDFGNDIVLICTPNNPTGAILDNCSLGLLEKKIRNGLAVISDEVYSFFESFKNSLLGIVDNKHNLYVVDSFSKCVGCPGLRIGILIGPNQDVKEIEKNRSITQSGINSLGVKVVTSLLAMQHHKKLFHSVSENKSILSLFLSSFPGEVMSGGMYVFKKFHSF